MHLKVYKTLELDDTLIYNLHYNSYLVWLVINLIGSRCKEISIPSFLKLATYIINKPIIYNFGNQPMNHC